MRVNKWVMASVAKDGAKVVKNKEMCKRKTGILQICKGELQMCTNWGFVQMGKRKGQYGKKAREGLQESKKCSNFAASNL